MSNEEDSPRRKVMKKNRSVDEEKKLATRVFVLASSSNGMWKEEPGLVT